MTAWLVWLPPNSEDMCLGPSPTLSVSRHWVGASTCAGSGGFHLPLPLVPSRTSSCSPSPCFTPCLWRLVLILPYSHQPQSFPCPALVGHVSLCCPVAWNHLCAAPRQWWAVAACTGVAHTPGRWLCPYCQTSGQQLWWRLRVGNCRLNR